MDADERTRLTASMDQVVAAIATDDVGDALGDVGRAVRRLWNVAEAAGVPAQGRAAFCIGAVADVVIQLSIDEAQR